MEQNLIVWLTLEQNLIVGLPLESTDGEPAYRHLSESQGKLAGRKKIHNDTDEYGPPDGG